MTKEFTPDPVFHSDADNKFVADEYKPLGKEVYVKKETGLDAMAGDGGYQEGTLAGAIRMRMRREGKRFWAGDNISDYLHDSDKEHLINEATVAFEQVLEVKPLSRLVSTRAQRFALAQHEPP